MVPARFASVENFVLGFSGTEAAIAAFLRHAGGRTPPFRSNGAQDMSRQILTGLVVVLLAGVGVLAWQLHEERKQPDGVEISIGQHGLSVKGK